MKSLGQELQERRLDAGLTRMDVFKKLRITMVFGVSLGRVKFNLAAVLQMLSIVRYRKSAPITSMTGLMPISAAPTAKLVLPSSEIGRVCTRSL